MFYVCVYVQPEGGTPIRPATQRGVQGTPRPPSTPASTVQTPGKAKVCVAIKCYTCL